MINRRRVQGRPVAEPDLRSVWTGHLALPDEPLWPEETRLLPRGWTLDAGLPEILAPFLGSPPRDRADLVRFTGVSGDAATRLLEVLPPLTLDWRHNLAPTTRSLLAAAAHRPDDVQIAGFAIGPGRSDEGISITTAFVRDTHGFRVAPAPWTGDDADDEWHPEWCECADLSLWVQAEYGLDQLVGPDELTPGGSWDDHETWRLWWD